MPEDYIEMSKCKDNWVYRIDARNGSFGIYREDKKHFELARNKFGDTFIDCEDHWDTGAPHGTVMPIQTWGPSPEFKDEDAKIKYLQKLEFDNDK